MTTNALLTATRDALAGVLGATWTVQAADDEWSALQLLSEAPAGIRAMLLPDEFKADGGDPKGLAGEQSLRLVVQIARGLAKDAAEPLGRLLDAEEHARRALLAIVFQLPADPDYTAATWLTPGSPPHPEVTGFRQTGNGAYKPPANDVVLEHPAREIRASCMMAYRIPGNNLRVNLPLSAGN